MKFCNPNVKKKNINRRIFHKIQINNSWNKSKREIPICVSQKKVEKQRSA